MLPPGQANKKARSSHGEELLMGNLSGGDIGTCPSPGERAV